MMPIVSLRDYQAKALERMHTGCILNGGVGSGKSRTSLAYYYHTYGGEIYYYNKNENTGKYDIGPYDFDTKQKITIPQFKKLNNLPDLYIITTARKRDTLEWEEEMLDFMFTEQKVVVDSWNNISKYTDVTNAFFIFDEQRVVGYGAWTKSFLKIAKNNEWILLSATPGDKWEDYVPVFIANGYFKNKTDFFRKHVEMNPYTPFPSIKGYVGTGTLQKMRRSVLIQMDFDRTTIHHHEHVVCDYDKTKYENIEKNRWDIYNNCPIENATQYCLTLRKLVNSSLDRQQKVVEIVSEHPKSIIFYNHDYELELLRNMFKGYPMGEWNGHKHEAIPEGDHWVYLVQYAAGCEGWNCIITDTIIFYSQNYSYRTMEQASGRIDRLNTPFTDLYYYHVRSDSKIDNSIRMALRRKKKFNEKAFAIQFEK